MTPLARSLAERLAADLRTVTACTPPRGGRVRRARSRPRPLRRARCHVLAIVRRARASTTSTRCARLECRLAARRARHAAPRRRRASSRDRSTRFRSSSAPSSPITQVVVGRRPVRRPARRSGRPPARLRGAGAQPPAPPARGLPRDRAAQPTRSSDAHRRARRAPLAALLTNLARLAGEAVPTTTGARGRAPTGARAARRGLRRRRARSSTARVAAGDAARLFPAYLDGRRAARQRSSTAGAAR